MEFFFLLIVDSERLQTSNDLRFVSAAVVNSVSVTRSSFQSSFELLLHPAASQCQFEWQHERVLHALMCQGQHSVALRYFHVMKPPVSSTSQAKLCLSVLLHNR